MEKFKLELNNYEKSVMKLKEGTKIEEPSVA